MIVLKKQTWRDVIKSESYQVLKSTIWGRHAQMICLENEGDKRFFIGLDKHIFECKIYIFSNPSISTYVLGAQKNRLVETVLLSTNTICFGWEIRKLIFLVRTLN